MTWIQTHSGRAFDFRVAFDPDLDAVPDFDLEDIAHALAGQNRYNGHGRGFYSVAEHSFLLSEYAERAGAPADLVRAFLLHDATEAYMGDMAAPLKAFFPDFGRLERRLGDKLRRWASSRYGVEIAPLHSPAISELDRRILLDEKAALFGPEPAPWGIPGGPLGVPVAGWSPKAARDLFTSRLRDLGVGS